jgi:hypothetical protein
MFEICVSEFAKRRHTTLYVHFDTLSAKRHVYRKEIKFIVENVRIKANCQERVRMKVNCMRRVRLDYLDHVRK